MSDVSYGENALYYGNSELPGTLPDEWHVYTGPDSFPGNSPAPTVSLGVAQPDLFRNPVIVQNAGTAEINGAYTAQLGFAGWIFVNENDDRFTMKWYRGYKGQPPRYYIEDQWELAFYYGDSPSRSELPIEWHVYEGPESTPGTSPAPIVRSEPVVVTVSVYNQFGGHMIVCTSLSGTVVAKIPCTQRTNLIKLGEIKGTIAKQIGFHPALLRLVTPDARILDGPDDQHLIDVIDTNSKVATNEVKSGNKPQGSGCTNCMDVIVGLLEALGALLAVVRHGRNGFSRCEGMQACKG